MSLLWLFTSDRIELRLEPQGHHVHDGRGGHVVVPYCLEISALIPAVTGRICFNRVIIFTSSSLSSSAEGISAE